MTVVDRSEVEDLEVAVRVPARPPADSVATFDDVFLRDYEGVARLAYLLLGGTGEAEEVAQEVFTVLLQRWSRVDNPSGFVRTAVVNRCRDVARRRTVRDRALRRLRPVPETVGDVDEDSMIVLDALRRIEPPLREVVVLRYYLGHTVPEIGGIVGCPEGTVKSRLHRATGRLRELLGS